MLETVALIFAIALSSIAIVWLVYKLSDEDAED